jgi:hypothetical protein
MRAAERAKSFVQVIKIRKIVTSTVTCSEASAGRPRGVGTPRAPAPVSVIHLKAKLLHLGGTQNAGRARADAGLRAALLADLRRARAHLAQLAAGSASGTTTATGETARRQGSGARTGGAPGGGGGGVSGSSGGGASISADVAARPSGAAASFAGRQNGHATGTQPTQRAPDGDEDDEDEDETDELIAMHMYPDEELEAELEEDEEDNLDELYQGPTPPESEQEDNGEEAEEMDED